jgi:hypothetical protein
MQTQPRFVIASWSYPDAYGQGINRFLLYENHTGSWVQVGTGYYYYFNSTIFNWTVGYCIKLLVYTYLNATLTGASTVAAAKLVQRHNATVTGMAGNVVFSKQNFTYFDYTPLYTGMWGFQYYVILNFLPAWGEYYTATITYDVFW